MARRDPASVPDLRIPPLLTFAAVTMAARVWRSEETGNLAHRHNILPSDHPHLAGAGGGRHAHAFVIDDFHREWPERVG